MPSAPQPHKAAMDTQLVYFNDEGRTPEQGKQKDDWNILFLGEKSGSRYGGILLHVVASSISLFSP